MALILVVEPEDRYVQRIRDALSSEGWQVQVVDGADKALSAAENEPPQLVLVNRQADGAERLFDAFARRTGGPGVVAMLPESAIDLADPLADEALAKPFTDQELRLAIRRGLHSEPTPAASDEGPGPVPTPERQLTTQDIFGDLVAEVEGEIQSEAPPAPDPPTPASPSPAPRQTPPQAPAPSQASAPSQAPAPPQASAPPAARPAAPSRPSFDDELDLEKTLSGLRRDLELDSRPAKPRESAPAAERTVRPTPPKETSKRPKISDDLDVDALLSETLSGFDLPSTRRKKKPAKSPSTPPRPEEPAREEPTRDAPEPEDTDPQEISFADLSAPSLQEVPQPDSGAEADEASIGDPFEGFGGGFAAEEASEEEADEEIEVDLEMDLEADDLSGIDLQSGLEASEDQEREPSSVSLGEWLESEEDSEVEMVEVEEPRPDLASVSRADAPEAETGAPDEGQRFGQYTLLDRIAVGGMAEVWKARMSGVEGFQKTVAIKKILPHLTDNDDFVDMFIDEAKLAAQLNHPNIIHIYDLGKIGDHFYIAMEYVEGKNLRALLNESRKKALPLPRGLAVLIAARLASALDHAHRKKDFEDRELGLVHRDVSPQNVLISEEGDIKLCDFGIVKAVSKASQTQMGALKGKLQYMSPEQAWGKDVDARSDIFSLGAILFEMLTGRRLFAGDNEISVLEAVRQCRVVAPRDLVPQIPEDVERITLKALEMDPERRYQTAGKLQQELESIVYSVKPALGPADLADYLERLSTAPEVSEAAAPAAEPAPAPSPEQPSEEPSGEAPREAVVAAAASSHPEAPARDAETGGSRPEEPEEVLTVQPDLDATEDVAEEQTGSHTGTLTQTGTPTPTGVLEPPPPSEVVQAVSVAGLDDLEEGGGKGRIWLWVLIGLLVVAGAAVTYYVYFVRPASPAATTEVDEPTAGESAQPLPGSPLDDIEPESDDFEDGDYEEGPDEPGAEGSTEPETETTPRSALPEPTRSPDETSIATAAAAAPAAAAPTAAAPTARPDATRARPTEPETVSTKTRPTETTSQEPSQEPSREPAPAETVAASPSRPAPVLLRPSAKIERTAEPEASESRPESEPLETVEVDEPAPRDSEPETEAPIETAREDSPRLRPAERTPEPPPQPPPEPEVRQGDLVGAGPGVKAPVLVRFDKPSYPPIARRMKMEGEVVLSLLVDENGRVLETRLIKGVREGVGLNEAALDAARRARYEPATKNGVRVKMWTTLRIPFRL